MSTHLTRIEREAEEYANKHGYRSNGVYDTTNDLEAAYEAGATAVFTRAAPVVKALEEIVSFYELRDLRPEHFQKAKQILETYKNDNV